MLRRQFLWLSTWVMCAGLAPRARQAITTDQLASYALSEPVFKRFAHATRLIGKVIQADARFDRDPLITKEIWVSGEAAEMASTLARRLEREASCNAALFAADITADDYARFAIALFGAHLAHGFVTSGAMRRVPPGIAADNVAFVAAREAEIAALLKLLRLQ